MRFAALMALLLFCATESWAQGGPPGTYDVFVEIGGRRSQVAALVVVG